MRFQRLARLNRVGTNRVLGPVVAHLAGFGIVHHVGRKSGREYATPVVALRHGDDFVIPLTYGLDTDWCRNVTAAGVFELERRGRRRRLVPEVHPAEDGLGGLPWQARAAVSGLRMPGYLIGRPAPA